MITRDQLLDEIITFYEKKLRPATRLKLSERGMIAVRRWPREKGDEKSVLPTRFCGLSVLVDKDLAVDYLLE